MRHLLHLLLAFCALLVVWPALLVIAILIRREDGGPVFYRGRRVGLDGRAFHIFKFRSMVLNAEKLGPSSTSDRDPRITRIGAFLRRYKLDELPQLFNVLAGEMHFVGPRPEVQKYVDMYTDEEKAILSVRPGITDWASIWNSDEGAVLAGSADPDRAYEELIRPTKLRLQLLYVREQSIATDLAILLCTAVRLLNRNYTPHKLASFPQLLPVRESAL